MKKLFQRFTLNAINLFGIFILFFFAMLFTVLVLFEEYRDFEHESIALRQTYLKTQKAKAKDETQRVVNYIEHIHSTMQSKMGDKELQENVVNSIEHLFDRQNGSSYIFIYTLDGINVSDPNKPENRGKNMLSLQDVNGKYMLQDLIQEAQRGGGFVEYVWDNPANGILSQKISYAIPFKPWGWMIGTGVYLNEIDALIAKNKAKLKKRLIKYMMEILTLSAILFWIAFAGIKLINNVIYREISTFREFFQRAVKHNIVIDKRQIHIKEFQVLVGYVNEMVSEIHQRNSELETLNISLEAKVLLKTAKLQKQIEYNKQLIKAQDSFIKHSIHEINTPLAVIMTHIDIRKMKFGEDKYLTKIEAASKMIANIYDDLSYMMKKDRVVYEKHWILFSIFLEKRIDFFEEIAAGNTHKIVSAIEPEISIYISDVELQRIVDNNLSNAIKYANKNTDIHVKLYKKDKEVILEFMTHSKQIKDTKRIFEPFHQEGDIEGGFGLGLEIVHAICKKENIKIYVNSDTQTTVFRYTFMKGSIINENSLT